MIDKNQNQKINTKYTFWHLLKEYKVEIPIIQRDYAQGRTSDNATAIREELLDCIYNALITEEGIDFDFVYGTVEKDTLYPLDGQQRLTTFYLLHWYLAEKEERMEEVVPVLSKFSYTTRTSSREFCEMLMKVRYTPVNGENVSSFIKNENGYFKSWDFDPTISHMLTMLDAIHEKFCETNELFNLLIAEEHDELLTFNYLPMEHYALTDDLYIKMNARGKALSIFENFKAKFIQHLKDRKLPYEYFEKNIDGRWTDLLWDYKSRDNTIDKQFMNFFCYITEMLYLETTPQHEGDSPFRPNMIRKLIDYYQDEHALKALYEYLDLWESKEEVSSYLNSILSIKSEKNKIRLFEGRPDIFSSIINGVSVSLANKLILFSIMKRLVVLGKETDQTAMKDYVRIIRNFLLNTRFFVRKKCNYSPDLRYGRHAIPIVQNFIGVLEDVDNPYDTLKDVKFENINSEICEQEKVKAKLILEKPELKSVIHGLEDMNLFRGSISNMIPYILEHDYKHLISNLKVLFTVNNGPQIIQALLSFGDYGINIGNSIYGDRYFYGNIKNWYSMLTFNGGKKHTKIICDFINQFEETYTHNVQDALDKLIENNLKNIKKNDWRYTIVKYYNTVKVENGYIDNPYVVFAMERCVDGSRILHRPNGFILNGYHVVPEYIEIEERLDNLCGHVVRGFAGESSGYISLDCAKNLKIAFDDSGEFIVYRGEEDAEWVSKTISKYKKIDSSNMDKVERAVLLINMLNKKGNEVYNSK